MPPKKKPRDNSNKQKISRAFSFDKDLLEDIDKAFPKNTRERSRLVNQILRDHLHDYLTPEMNRSTIDEERIRQIFREELSKANFQPVAPPYEESAAMEREDVLPDEADEVMAGLDEFLGMRKE